MALGDPPDINSLLSVSGVPDMWAHVNHQELEAQLKRDMAQAQMQAQINAHLASGAQQAGMTQQANPFPKPLDKATWRPDIPSSPTPLASRAREMFLKRMGGIRSEMKVSTDDFLACHIHKDQVYVFYCFDGRHGVTVEGIDLFPSDTLITQFRLVLT